MHTFPCQPATRPSSGEHNQHQHNQGSGWTTITPFILLHGTIFVHPHSTIPLHIGVSNRSMSFLYSSSIRRTAMKWLSETIPTAQLFWSNSKLSHMRRALCGTMGLFLFYQRGREQVHVMLWIPMQEEVKEGRMMGGKKFLAQEKEVLFVSQRKGGKWGEASRWICGYVLSLLETCNYLKSGMTRS